MKKYFFSFASISVLYKNVLLQGKSLYQKHTH